ncbi:MAG TPA: FHA domain-containing protein, partial [Polyangiales bacterium]|nr:FHA domain-containing protein [Polyangiales bacterium]
DLLESVARDPLELLRKGIGAAPFLIVRLDDFSNDLGLGLAASDEAVNRRRFRGSIKSTLQISVGMTEQLRVPRFEEQPAAKPGANKTSAPRPGFPVPEWLNARCYVVRLTNRSEAQEPLTIGRDTSHKIVLLHPSVSATHAQLTVGPELSLRDTKSRNGTFVNGKQVKGVVPLQVGDRIKFGAVQALLCSADDLWYAVR